MLNDNEVEVLCEALGLLLDDDAIRVPAITPLAERLLKELEESYT